MIAFQREPSVVPAKVEGEPTVNEPVSVEELLARLRQVEYLADTGLATALHLAVRLRHPLLLEGEAGVGKTEAAKALARALDQPMIRLQCYEGLDVHDAVYEWNYGRQLLAIRRSEAGGGVLGDLYSEEFLIRRPLLRSLEGGVLLIDELDRADDEFEAFLLEFLGEFSVTIPERGAFRAVTPPVVVLTSNRTRELHDALKRRCYYHWIEHPTPERELEILRARLPGLGADLARDVATAVARLRAMELRKPPGIAESLDWAQALGSLGVARLSAEAAERTLGVVLKYREDTALVQGRGLSAVVGA
ncbi:MoxR family ATPase [bacterium]|nr:MAG: MoxR family ATPase [bacterium]